MSDTDVSPAARGSRAPSRVARTGWGLLALVWIGLTVWLLVQFVATTWNAGVLLVRGEVVQATVVEVDLRTRFGREDELVVTTGPPHTGRAEIATYREDIPVGAVVPVVVDPDDTSRASLAEDGWPWYATLFPLFMAPLAALAALLTVGRAVGDPAPDGDRASGTGETGGTGGTDRARDTGTPPAPRASEEAGSDGRG